LFRNSMHHSVRRARPLLIASLARDARYFSRTCDFRSLSLLSSERKPFPLEPSALSNKRYSKATESCPQLNPLHSRWRRRGAFCSSLNVSCRREELVHAGNDWYSDSTVCLSLCLCWCACLTPGRTHRRACTNVPNTSPAIILSPSASSDSPIQVCDREDRCHVLVFVDRLVVGV